MIFKKQALAVVMSASLCMAGLPVANANPLDEVSYDATAEAAKSVESRTVTHDGNETTETVVLTNGDTFVTVFNEDTRICIFNSEKIGAEDINTPPSPVG